MSSILVDQYQVALFPDKFELPDNKVLKDLLLETKLFQSEQITLNPFPEDAPEEINRVEATTIENDIKVQISPQKTLVQLLNVQDKEDFIIDIESDSSSFRRIVEKLYSKVKFSRVGCIVMMYKPMQNPTAILQNLVNIKDQDLKNRLRSGKLKMTFDLEMDTHSGKNNLNITIGSARLVKNSIPVFAIEADMNTHPSINVNWDCDSAFAFLREALSKLEPETIFKQFLSEADSESEQ